MTRDQFIYALTACGCLLKDGKTWYEHNELIKCFEDLGLFEQEPFINKPCVSSEVCEHDKNKVLDKIRAEIMDCLKALDEIEKSGLNIYFPNEMSGRRLTYQQCLEFIDKYKAEMEVEDGNDIT